MTHWVTSLGRTKIIGPKRIAKVWLQIQLRWMLTCNIPTPNGLDHEHRKRKVVEAKLATHKTSTLRIPPKEKQQAPLKNLPNLPQPTELIWLCGHDTDVCLRAVQGFQQLGSFGPQNQQFMRRQNTERLIAKAVHLQNMSSTKNRHKIKPDIEPRTQKWTKEI